MLRSLCLCLLVLCCAPAALADVQVTASVLTAEQEAMNLVPQVALGGGWFSFGSSDADTDGFQDAQKRYEKEKNKLEDTKDQVGDETFQLIQDQLKQKGRKGFEDPKAPQTRDGGKMSELTRVKPFSIDKTAVTVDAFRRFVRETKVVTEAEKFQWSFVHELLLSEATIKKVDAEDGIGRVKESPHWCAVLGAHWRRPEGTDSSIKGRGGEPAVHVSWNDAVAYCKWAGRRLPTEQEWEFAARGNHEDAPFPWGEQDDEKMEKAEKRVNGWHGKFPKENTKVDGFVGLAPADAFEPNDFGLHNTVGNVWEWVGGGTKEKRILRGGSYVDTVSGEYNHLLRVSTRMENSADSGGHNTGFRCAASKPKKKKARKAQKAEEVQLEDKEDL